MNNLIVLAVLATTVVVHSETTCNGTYDIEDDNAIKQQYDDNLDCTNNIKCKNAMTQFTNTAGNLTSNEVLFIIRNSDEEFKFEAEVSLLTKAKVYDDTIIIFYRTQVILLIKSWESLLQYVKDTLM